MGRALLPSSTVPLERYTYSITYCLFYPEKIVPFSFVATLKTKILYPPPLLIYEDITAFFLVFLKKLFVVHRIFQSMCVVLALGTVATFCVVLLAYFPIFFHRPTITR
jgi:hypothetical protein